HCSSHILVLLPALTRPSSPLFPYTTLFRSELELATAPRPLETAPAPQRPARAAGGHRKRILLVEDHADTAKVMSRLLAAAGHEIDRKSTRLNSSHQIISYAVFCLKKKTRL